MAGVHAGEGTGCPKTGGQLRLSGNFIREQKEELPVLFPAPSDQVPLTREVSSTWHLQWRGCTAEGREALP